MYHKNEPFHVAQYIAVLYKKKNGNHHSGKRARPTRPTRPPRPHATHSVQTKHRHGIFRIETSTWQSVTRAVANRHGRIQVPPEPWRRKSKCFITIVCLSPLRIGWFPLQMAKIPWLINGGDPNHLHPLGWSSSRRHPVIPNVRIVVNEPPKHLLFEGLRASLHTDPHQVLGGFWMSTVGLLDDQIKRKKDQHLRKVRKCQRIASRRCWYKPIAQDTQCMLYSHTFTP